MNQIKQVIKILKSGGIVVYPTDTSYGLAVDATNQRAVRKLYKLKGRDFKKPIHVIIPDKYFHASKHRSIRLSGIVGLNWQVKKLMKKFWPGPLTLVLPLKSRSAGLRILSAGTKTLGIRMPNNKIALELVKKFGKPITTTSANISGKNDCYSIDQVKKQFKNLNFRPDYYLDGGKLPKIKPSTVVSLVHLTPSPRLRQVGAGDPSPLSAFSKLSADRQERGVLIRRKLFGRATILREGPITKKQIFKELGKKV